eukprot:6517865-Karenia_brevis.AAC.1
MDESDPADPYEAAAYGAEGYDEDIDPDAPDPADPDEWSEMALRHSNQDPLATAFASTEDSPENYEW